jgi:predicted exporter
MPYYGPLSRACLAVWLALFALLFCAGGAELSSWREFLEVWVPVILPILLVAALTLYALWF